jgi:site-specific recombinase XerD
MTDAKEKTRGVFEKFPDSGVWWIQYFDASGRRRREKVGAKKAAIKLVEKRRTQAREGVKMPENLRAKPATFADLAERAKAYSKANKRSYDHDVQRMKHLTEEFGNRTAEDITRGDIQKWLDSKAEDWSIATRNRHLALLKLTFRLAEEDGTVKTNPARLVRQSKEDNGRVRYLSDAEDATLRAVIQKSYVDHLPEFEVAVMTGMCQGEQFSRQWNDIDFDAGTIRLQISKNGKCRFIHLNTRALAALRMLHAQSVGSGPVFPNKKPRWFTDAVREAKLEDFTWHDLRHTFASRLVMAGVDIRTVQELMGHKSITMTMRYAHLSPQHRIGALERLCQPSATTGATSQFEEKKAVVVNVN